MRKVFRFGTTQFLNARFHTREGCGRFFGFCGPSKFWSVVPLTRKFAGETSVGLSYHFVNLSFLFVFLGVIRHSGKLAFIVLNT